MIPAAVRYLRASSTDEALEALADPDAKVLAGGQSLLPVMKLRIARPSLLVDIGRLELREVDIRDGELHIGPLTTWHELLGADAIRGRELAAIVDCASGIGDLQVRNRGTVGGSLAHADPASDFPAVLLALGAKVVLRSPPGERSVALDDFLLGPYTTALGAQELITDVVVRVPEFGSASAYVSVEHPASGFALAGAAALVAAHGPGTVALTGVGARPTLLPPEADPLDAEGAIETFGDRFAPVEYRRHLAATVVRRALEQAVARAMEDDR